MFDYLQQFNGLPKKLRDQVSSSEAMAYLSELEKKYSVDLAMVVMKVMIKSLAIKDLNTVFVNEFNLAPDKADSLTEEMKTKIFAPVADYVGISSSIQALNLNDNIETLIKEAGITIVNSILVDRLKTVLSTYIKGIRQRIDTRQVLAKEVSSGGLGLSQAEIDRVFKVCDLKKYQPAIKLKTPSASPRLENIVNKSEEKKTEISRDKSFGVAPEYDLKRALASGETKKISPAHPSVVSEEVSKQEEASAQQKPKEETVEKKPNVSNSDDQAIVENELKKLKIQTVEKEQGVADVSKNVVDNKKDKEPFIVRKPDNTSFFKKIFAESQKQTGAGAVKLAKVVGGSNKPDSKVSAGNNKPLVSEPTSEKSLDKKQEVNKSTEKESQGQQPKVKEPIPKQVEPVKAAPKRVVNSASSTRPKMHDVKAVPKVMGPLEELQFLNVINFRRLGSTPEESTIKIFSKVKLLEKEGYGKMIEAITAWKKSPVNRLYLKIVQRAIATGKTVKETATGLAGNTNSLSFAEIEAIINLNTRLTF